MVIGQNTKSIEPVFNSLSNFQNVRDFTLSSNGEEAYITIQSPLSEISVIVEVTKIDNSWSEPKIVSFSGKYSDLEGFLSPDNLRLYFVSNRPLNNKDNKAKDYDIWYVERNNINLEWGAPINLGAPINTSDNEFYPSVSINNNLYFTSDGENTLGKDDIFYSVWSDNTYSDPINLGNSINTVGYEFNSFISPDENYIIFSGYNRGDGQGSGDLYISYKNETNTWGKATNLGKEINSKQMDYCPFVDSKTGILYFTSKRSVFSESNNFQSINDLLMEIDKSENGLSRIYKTHFDIKYITFE